MTLKTINFSTGPLHLSKEGKKVISEEALSHRSPDFYQLLEMTADLFKEKFRVKDVFLLSGSGTLANEVMIQQIKMTGQKGLILSNGEFGDRLKKQATVGKLDFIAYNEPSGNLFDPNIILNTIEQNNLSWILFCHCETSTGVVNDLDFIVRLAIAKRIKCFVDCISTVGVMDINLSGVSMASASSGKGLNGVAGLAIILSNTTVASDGSIPNYLDLCYYKKRGGIPFTISSLLLKALLAGARLKLDLRSFRRTAEYANEMNKVLKNYDLIPYTNFHVFTLTPVRYEAWELGKKLRSFGIVSSYQSEYLESHNRLQLALFGHYDDCEERWGINRLKLVLEEMLTRRSQVKGHFVEMVIEIFQKKSRYNSAGI